MKKMMLVALFVGFACNLQGMSREDYVEFFEACAEGNVSSVRDWVENRRADVNFVRNQYAREGSPLFCALYNGNIPVAKYLIDKGADVNFVLFSSKETPLHRAFLITSEKNSDKQIAEIIYSLVSHGANVNAKDARGETPYAAYLNSKSSSEEYPQFGSVVNENAIRAAFAKGKKQDVLLSSPGDDSSLSQLPQDTLNEIRKRHARLQENNYLQQLLEAKRNAELGQ
jgi:hypothetical protein